MILSTRNQSSISTPTLETTNSRSTTQFRVDKDSFSPKSVTFSASSTTLHKKNEKKLKTKLSLLTHSTSTKTLAIKRLPPNASKTFTCPTGMPRTTIPKKFASAKLDAASSLKA